MSFAFERGDMMENIAVVEERTVVGAVFDSVVHQVTSFVIAKAHRN